MLVISSYAEHVYNLMQSNISVDFHHVNTFIGIVMCSALAARKTETFGLTITFRVSFLFHSRSRTHGYSTWPTWWTAPFAFPSHQQQR